jgi:hypothetical protein
VLGYDPLRAGLAFLPMTLVMFATVQVVPRLIRRIGPERLLVGGLAVALAGMAWLSVLSAGSPFVTGVAAPLVLLGAGMGAALAPLTAAGIAGVAERDAGAASGLVNVAQQLGGSLGLAALVTVFASAGGDSAVDGSSTHALAHAVSSALTGSAILLALGLAVVVGVMRVVPAPAGAVARLRAWAVSGRSAG